MSRSQKPGKFKLVGTTPAVPARRIGDKVSDERTADASVNAGVHAHAAEHSGSRGILLALLFLLACVGGGSGAVYFGLVGGLAG
jgi:hypothetical protein